MADFAGLLKKTIDAQANPTPQLRDRVYARARETVERKLAATTVSQDIVRDQLAALEDAIRSVEEEYVAVERSLLSTITTQSLASDAHESDDVTDYHAYSDAPKDDLAQSEEIKSVTSKGAVVNVHEGGSFSNTEITNEQALSSNRISASSGSDRRNDVAISREKKAEKDTSKPYTPHNVLPSKADVPDAEPVNMDDVLEVAGQFDLEKRERDAQSAKALATQNQNNDYDIVSDIFVQAARRTGRKAARKRALIIAGSIAIVVLVVAVVLFTAWRFLLNRATNDENEIPVVETSNSSQTVEKLTQRLLADGSEVDEGPAQSEAKPEEGTSTASGHTAEAEQQHGEAIFYQARTEQTDEKVETGSVDWSLVKEGESANQGEELAIRGTITIPDEKLSLRLTLRRNTDSTLPAAYLMELIFIVPDGFEGKAIDNVHELTFKDSEQSTGQQLAGTIEAKIDDDFFLFALSGANPFRDRNLQLMRQLGWIRLVITDKNNRVSELTFSKGPTGDKIFREVIDQWLDASKKPTVYDEKKQSEQSQNDAAPAENAVGSDGDRQNAEQSGTDGAANTNGG